MKQLLFQLKKMYQNTFDFKGKTTLSECTYALLFQLFLLMITMLIILANMVTIVSPILTYSAIFVLVVNVLSLISLVIRRLRDAGVYLFQLFIIPLSYLLIGVIYALRIDSLADIYPLIMMIIFFLSHFYIIMLILMPSKEV